MDNCHTGGDTDLGTLYPSRCQSPPKAPELLMTIYRQRERQVKGKTETTTCHAKALCFFTCLV